jgi:UDP-N-acetyl-2-amino-2-deoxyglucuronate dehydrogenase
MSGKLGVGVVGAGWVAGEHMKAFNGNPHTQVRGVFSPRKATAEAKMRESGVSCRVYDSYEDMLKADDIQIVAICSPHPFHPEQTIKAAEAGKQILVEKPVALNLSDLRAMRDAVRKAKVITTVSFVLRWNPLFETIKALLASKAIGDVFYGEVDYYHGIGPWYGQYAWHIKKEMGGSALLTAGCHAVDGLRWFFDDEAVEVSAYSTTSPHNPLKYEYAPNTVCIVKFASGKVGKCAASVECRMPYVFNITLLGEGGAIINNKLASLKLLPGQTNFAQIPTILPDSGDVTHHPFVAEIAHFVACVRAKKESHANIEDTVKTHELCFAADLSVREGRPVKLPLP